MSDSTADAIEGQRAFLAGNPDYRRACYAAWKCGEATFRKFLENDDATRRFVTREMPFLLALFELPEFQG